MPSTTKLLQYIGFIFTEIFNTILLFLILTKASTRFGSYKYLMITFAVYSIVYGIVEILTQPLYCSTKYGFLIFVDSYIKSNPNLSSNLIMIYSGSYGFCITLLTFHFIFRYIAVCRPNCLKIFEGKRIISMVIPPFIVLISWGILIKFQGSPSPAKNAHFRDCMAGIYGEDISELGYMAVLYYDFDLFGNRIPQLNQFLDVISVSFLMTFLVGTIVFCAVKTCHKVLDQKSMSRRTRDLNKQLFQTLILQFIVPSVTMFIPVALLMILPIFQIDIGFLGNICGVSAGWYPGWDALIAMVMIKDFRRAICRCGKRGDGKVSSTNNETTIC